MGSWRFLLTDSRFVPQGEVLHASDRRVSLGLRKLDTASLKVRTSDPLAVPLAECRGYLKAYRDDELMFFGPLVSSDEESLHGDVTISVNAISAGWALSKRLAAKASQGTVFTATDRAQIVKSLIDTANDETGPVGGPGGPIEGKFETGIRTTTYVPSSASTVTYTAGPFKPILEILNELSAPFDGFDWRFLPIENWVDGAFTDFKIADFYALPVIGTNQPNAVFEWGTGRRNLAKYTIARDRTNQITQAFHHIQSGPDVPGYPVVTGWKAECLTEWGLLEEVVSGDLYDQSLRQSLVNEHIAVRATPRVIVSAEPHIDPAGDRLPNYGQDYSLGDTVRFRAEHAGTVRMDGEVRVWGVDFDIDANGVEKASLTLVEEG